MFNNTASVPIINTTTQKVINFQPEDFDYLPYKALTTKSLAVNEFTGNYYQSRFFPLKCGKELDGSRGYYVMGYALHDEDVNFSRIVIGDIPTLTHWNDLYDSTHGFIVAFQYVGYSEVYKKLYGIYVSHEITYGDFDQFS